MRCYSLILGARNTSSAGQNFSSKDDELVRTITFRHFAAGFTILNADGGWFDPARGAFIAEESRQILVCTAEEGRLGPWCEALARALNQKELLVVELGRAFTFQAGEKAKPARKGRVRIRHRTF